jgi:hypothetical protein
MNMSMKKTSKEFLVIAELLFLFSLFMPAVETRLFDKPGAWEGWRIALLAIWSLGDVAKRPTWAAVFLAGIGNIVFLVAPLLLCRPVGVAARRAFCGGVVCALAFALGAPVFAGIGSLRLLVAYFVWLMAYVALLTSAMFSVKTLREAAPTEQLPRL